jgi:hypothetical protein
VDSVDHVPSTKAKGSFKQWLALGDMSHVEGFAEEGSMETSDTGHFNC